MVVLPPVLPRDAGSFPATARGWEEADSRTVGGGDDPSFARVVVVVVVIVDWEGGA